MFIPLSFLLAMAFYKPDAESSDLSPEETGSLSEKSTIGRLSRYTRQSMGFMSKKRLRKKRGTGFARTIEPLDDRTMLSINPVTLPDGHVIDSSDDVEQEIQHLRTTLDTTYAEASTLPGIDFAAFDAMALDAYADLATSSALADSIADTETDGVILEGVITERRQALLSAQNTMETMQRLLDDTIAARDALLASSTQRTLEAADAAVRSAEEDAAHADAAYQDILDLPLRLETETFTYNESVQRFMVALGNLSTQPREEAERVFQNASADYVLHRLALNSVQAEVELARVSGPQKRTAAEQAQEALHNAMTHLENLQTQHASHISTLREKNSLIDNTRSALERATADVTLAEGRLADAEQNRNAIDASIEIMLQDPILVEAMNDVHASRDFVEAYKAAEAERAARLETLRTSAANLLTEMTHMHRRILEARTPEELTTLIGTRTTLRSTLRTVRQDIGALDPAYDAESLEAQEYLQTVTDLALSLQSAIEEKAGLFSELQPLPARQWQQTQDLKSVQGRITPLTQQKESVQSVIDDCLYQLNILDERIVNLQAHPEQATGEYVLDWMNSSSAIATVPGTEGKETMGVAISPDGRFIGRGDRGGNTELIDARTGTLLLRVPISFNGKPVHIWDMSFNADGTKLVSLHAEGRMTIIDTETLAVTTQSVIQDHFFGNVRWVGNEIYVSMQAIGAIRIVNADTGAQRAFGSIGGTDGISVVQNSKIFAAGSYGPLTLYSADGTLLAQAPSPGPVNVTAASDDGSLLAIFTSNGIVQLYDSSLNLLATHTGAGRGCRLTFISGNKGLAAFDPNGSFIVYDLSQIQSGSLGTPLIIPTNGHQGHSTSMGVTPDGSALLNIDPNNGILVTALPDNFLLSPFDRALQQLERERSVLLTNLHMAENEMQRLEDLLTPLQNDADSLQSILSALTVTITNLTERLQILDTQMDAIKASMTADVVFREETENGGPLNAEQMQAADMQAEELLEQGLMTIPQDALFSMSESLSSALIQLPMWMQNLEARRTLLQTILQTADPADVPLLQEKITHITGILQSLQALLTETQAAWLFIGNSIDAQGVLQPGTENMSVLFTEELQSTLYTLSLELPVFNRELMRILGETLTESALLPSGNILSENGIKRLALSLSTLGGHAVFSAFPPATHVTTPLTVDATTLTMGNGAAVLDLSQSLTLVTAVTGTAEQSGSSAPVSIMAYRGMQLLSTTVTQEDGTFRIADPAGITSLIIRSDSGLSISNLNVEGEWGRPQADAEAPGPSTNATLSMLTAPVLPFGNIDTYKNSISLTHVDSGPWRGHWVSYAGVWIGFNANNYVAVRLTGPDPAFEGLNYVRNDGQTYAYPRDRYEVIGNVVLIYPSGIPEQRDLFITSRGTDGLFHMEGPQREGLLPPLVAPPAVGLAGRGWLGDGSSGWGNHIGEWSENDHQTESFMGHFNVQNPSLTGITLSSVKVHVGPRGTAADPVTATLDGSRSLSPGGACSFHIPIHMNGPTYNQYWTITAIDGNGAEIVVASGNFHKPHPIGFPSGRRLARLALQGLRAAQTLNLSSSTIAFYQGVVQEFQETGDVSNATAYQFTSTPSYALIEERENLMDTKGEAMRTAFINKYLAEGNDLSTATQRADYKMTSIITNPALYAEIFGLSGFDQTNETFERLLDAGVAYAVAQTGYATIAGEDLSDIFLSDSMLTELSIVQEKALQQLILSSLRLPVHSGDGTWYVQEGSDEHIGTEANAIDLNLRYSAMSDLGKSVYAAASGVIVLIDEADGRMVLRHEVTDPSTGEPIDYYTEYVHMQNMRFTLLGRTIAAGTQIGEIGRVTADPDSPITSGLHFNTVFNGKSLNMHTWLSALRITIEPPNPTGSDREIGGPVSPVNFGDLQIGGITRSLAQGNDWQTITVNGNNLLFSVNPQSNVGSILQTHSTDTAPWARLLGPENPTAVSQIWDALNVEFDLFNIDATCDILIAEIDAKILLYQQEYELPSTSFAKKALIIDAIGYIQALKWGAEILKGLTPNTPLEVAIDTVLYLSGLKAVSLIGKNSAFILKELDQILPASTTFNFTLSILKKVDNVAHFNIGTFIDDTFQTLIQRGNGVSAVTKIDEIAGGLLAGGEKTSIQNLSTRIRNIAAAESDRARLALWDDFLNGVTDVNEKAAWELLMPEGRAIGSKGSSYIVRKVTGNLDDAKIFFEKLVRGGTKIRESAEQITYKMPNGQNLTLRYSSTDESPSINITNYMGVEFDKIHFYP